MSNVGKVVKVYRIDLVDNTFDTTYVMKGIVAKEYPDGRMFIRSLRDILPRDKKKGWGRYDTPRDEGLYIDNQHRNSKYIVIKDNESYVKHTRYESNERRDLINLKTYKNEYITRKLIYDIYEGTAEISPFWSFQKSETVKYTFIVLTDELGDEIGTFVIGSSLSSRTTAYYKVMEEYYRRKAGGI